ncbi:MAG: hypothetical protein KDJ80_13635 [Nitratireductor sp.]|nr:hypothetical protein [Nitratireductor sp.]
MIDIKDNRNTGPLDPVSGEGADANITAVAEQELRLLGEGHIAYLRPVSVPHPDSENHPGETVSGIGVFSATGNLAAVCQGMAEAGAFAFENNLVLVARH